MAEENKKKISELQEATIFSGSEKVPLAVSGSNRSAEMAALKEYFKDNNLVVFAEIVDTDVTVSNSPLTPEEGAVIGVVYLSKKQAFVERKTVSGVSSYSNQYARRTDYMDGASVREDKIFYCQADKKLYAYSEGKLECISSDVVIEDGSITEDKLSPEVVGKLSTGLAKDIVFAPTQDLQSNNVQGALETLDSGKLGKKDVVQELGESEDKVISQKGVNSALTGLKDTLSGRFIEHIYKPDYTPNLSKLTPGDYFTTDLFDCYLKNFPKNADGSQISLMTTKMITRKKIVYQTDGTFKVFNTGGSVDFIKLPISFQQKSITKDGISFKAYIDNHRYPLEYSLKYADSRAESGVTDAYWSTTVIYYDLNSKSIKGKTYSVSESRPGVLGFSDIDISTQCYIVILKTGVSFVNSYFDWQNQQNVNDNKTKGKFVVESPNEYNCNVSRIEDVVGSSLKFQSVLYSTDSQIELTEYRESYWIFGISEGGIKEFNNILFNGFPIQHECDDNSVYILSVDENGGNYTVTKFPNYIGAHWPGMAFAGESLSLGSGTYVLAGLNTLHYSKNTPTGVTGVSRDDTKIIGVAPGGYESTSERFNQVHANVKGVSFYNVKLSSASEFVKVEDCRFRMGPKATYSSFYFFIYEKEDSYVSIKNTEFIAEGNIFSFLWISGNDITIEGCSFSSTWTSVPVRVVDCQGFCSIKGNRIENSKTGIFLGSNRDSLIKNVVIESNIVKRCSEESISLDAFGNNMYECPVIAKSYVDSMVVGDDRISTIRLRSLYYVRTKETGYESAIVDASTVNPMKCLFIIVDGEHRYAMFEPLSATQILYEEGGEEHTTYEITVRGDLTGLEEGTEVGFYTGFYNCVVRGNIVDNAGIGYAAAGHGVSLFGGGYGCKIENNVLIGCNCGIQMRGFNSFGVFEPSIFSYGLCNSIKDNTIQYCNEAIRVGAYPTGYDHLKDAYTKIIGNTFLRNGNSNVTNTKSLIFSNNILEKSNVKFSGCEQLYNSNNIILDSEVMEN